jgi:hypothetical protein
LVLTTTVAARAQGENLVQNNSFESGPSIPAGQDSIPVSGMDLPSWKASSSGVEYNNQSTNPSDGQRSISLYQGLEPGWVEQTIDTVPGVRYQVLCDGKLLNGAAVNILQVDITVDGMPATAPRFVPPFNEFQADLSSTFVAQGNSTDLRFTNRIPAFLPNMTIQLDRIRVNEAPIDAGTAPGGRTAGDLNHDGHIDLIRESAVYLGNAAGTYVFSSLVGDDAEAIGDIDGDGNPDLYAGGSVMLGDGQGGFTMGAAVGAIDSPVFGDVNSDGRGDLVGVKDSSRVVVRVGDGQGGFGPEIPFDVGFFPPATVALCDINHDDKMDMVVGFLFKGPTVLLGDGTGFFYESPTVPPSYESVALVTGDVNGDGITDIVTAAGEAEDPIFNINRIPVFLGNGDGSFTVTDYQVYSPFIDSISIGDLDGDGNPDIFAQDWILLSDGEDGFLPPRRLPTPGELVDIDSDGLLDLVSEEMIYLSQRSHPEGTVIYGSGTPGCAGNMGIAANSTPSVGNQDFEVRLTNLPRQSMGTLLVGGDNEATDPLLTFGLRIHIGIDRMRFMPTMFSDCNGAARVRLPIPDSSLLVGSRFYLQGLWTSDPSMGDNCSEALMGLQTTRALAIDVREGNQ